MACFNVNLRRRRILHDVPEKNVSVAINNEINHHHDHLTVRSYPTNISNVVKKSGQRTLVLVFSVKRTGSTSLINHLTDPKYGDLDNLARDHYSYVNFSTCVDDDEEDDRSMWHSILGGTAKASKYPLDLKIIQSCMDSVPFKNDAIAVLDFVSMPMLSDDSAHWKKFQEIFNHLGWKVIPVVSYRRFYDWLPSYMSSLFEHMKGKTTFEKGIYLPYGGFDEFQRYVRRKGSVYSKDWGETAEDIHPTEAVANLLSRHLNDVVLYDVHTERNDFVASFYCHSLHAHSTGEGRRKQGLSRKDYASSTFNYELIVDAMNNERGVLPDKLNAKDIFTAIRNRQASQLKSEYDLPLKCPLEDVYRWIIETSLRYEEQLLSTQWNSREHKRKATDLHRSDFEKLLQSHKYCVVDTVRVIADEEWREYLSSRTRKNLFEVFNFTQTT